MTTIAVNKNMMAGDKQFTHRSGMLMTGKTKIYELPVTTAESVFDTKRAFVGFAGDADQFSTAIGWLFDPTAKVPKIRDIEMLLLNHKGYIYHATTLGNWTRITDKFYSIGSGMNYAQAAMEAGKTPYEAVKIAAKWDTGTGQGFNKLEMET